MDKNSIISLHNEKQNGRGSRNTFKNQIPLDNEMMDYIANKSEYRDPGFCQRQRDHLSFISTTH